MKLTKVLCIAMLVAMSAAIANAGSVLNDPKLTINGKPGGTAQPAFHHFGDPSFGFPTGFSSATPLIIPYFLGETLSFTFTGPTTTFGPSDTFKFFYLELTGIPLSTVFFCGGNVFSPSCGQSVVGVHTGPPITTDNEFLFSFGTLTAGDVYSISVQPDINLTPEPGTVLLFLSLIPALGFAAKRWNLRQTA